MRSATLAFLALAILANSSAKTPTPTSTTTRGEDRHYADALEDLEREMMTMMTADTSGDGGGGGGGGPLRKADKRGDAAGRWSRSTPSTTTTTTNPTTGLHRHRLDVDGEHAGYKSHHLWKEDKREELEGMRRRASEALAIHDEGREILDERDLKNLARRMAALERKMRSVDGETPEGVSRVRSGVTACLCVRR